MINKIRIIVYKFIYYFFICMPPLPLPWGGAGVGFINILGSERHH